MLALVPAAAALAQTPKSAEPAVNVATAEATADDVAPAYWRSAKDGWFWYAQPPAPPQVQTAKPKAAAPKSSLDRDLQGMKKFKEEVAQSLDAAVWNPSPENVARFLELQAQSRRKASAFTDITRVVHARMPWLSADADGVRPTNPVAADTFDNVQREQRESLLHSLAQSHGLYFFFRSDCRYCHAFAPLLKQFEIKYGLSVFAVSLDGGPIPYFPQAVRDNGTFMRILVDAGIPPEKVQVPFTALASPRTREVMPVGFGVMSAEELAERIELVVQNKDASTPPPGLLASPAMTSALR